MSRYSDRIAVPKASLTPQAQMPVQTQGWVRFAWVGLALFACAVALLGGSSHPDAPQLVALRPLSALFLIPAFYLASFERLKPGAMLIGLLAALALWMAIQLVPLPPQARGAVHDYSLITQLDAAVGLEGVWRPLSFVPTRGWNALASLIVPATALLLALTLGVSRRALLLTIGAVGLLDALVGVAQVLSGGADALYLYKMRGPTNDGLFANPNHSAVFSGLTMLIAARLGLDLNLDLGAGPDGRSSEWARGRARREAWREPEAMRFVYAASFAVCLFSMMVSASRTGFVLAIAVTAISAAMLYRRLQSGVGRVRHRRKPRAKLPVAPGLSPRIGLGVGALGLAGIVAAFVYLERAPGYETFFQENAFEGLRWQLAPVLQAMIADYGLLGIGFGAFEEVYHIYEPTQLLLPQYINQAHNDWAQFALEGGAPGVVILLILLGWIARGALRLVRGAGASVSANGGVNAGTARTTALFWLGVFAILGAASLVDYPLRTPLYQMASIWLLLVFTFDRHGFSSEGARSV